MWIVCLARLTKVVQRIQTLAAFMHGTQRAAVVTGDIDSIVPSDIVIQASRNTALHVQLTSYAEAVVRAWQGARAWEAEHITQATRSATDAARAQFIDSKQTLFQTYTATACDAPMPEVVCPQGQPTTTITLEHTALEYSVPACLWRTLAARELMDSLLITQPADVLMLNVQRLGAQHVFRMDPVIYLDPFLWSQRQGHRIDGTDECRQLQQWATELSALETQLKILIEPTASPIEPLLEQAAEHYAGQDQVMHSWVQRIQQQVQRQVTDIRIQQQALQSRIQDARRHLAALAEQAAQDTSLQTVPYDLCAAIIAMKEADCVYVRYEESWWRIENGTVAPVRRKRLTQCEFATCIADTRGIDDDLGLVHMVYTRRGATLSGYRPDNTAMQHAMDRDNERALSDVAQATESIVH